MVSQSDSNQLGCIVESSAYRGTNEALVWELKNVLTNICARHTNITFYILPPTTMTADSSTLEVDDNMIALQSVASIAARVRTRLLKGKRDDKPAY
jgi:hypothetical protein